MTTLSVINLCLSGPIGISILIISLSLASYLKETLDRSTTLGILIGGTIGYMASINLLQIFAA